MSTATAGRAREHRTRDRMVEAGWIQDARSAGSKGPADLWMSHDVYGGALVQVGTVSKRLGPADRERLVSAAERWSALPLLATWSRSGVTYFVVTRDTPSTWHEWSPSA